MNIFFLLEKHVPSIETTKRRKLYFLLSVKKRDEY